MANGEWGQAGTSHDVSAADDPAARGAAKVVWALGPSAQLKPPSTEYRRIRSLVATSNSRCVHERGRLRQKGNITRGSCGG
jgi:hypothetical protein